MEEKEEAKEVQRQHKTSVLSNYQEKPSHKANQEKQHQPKVESKNAITFEYFAQHLEKLNAKVEASPATWERTQINKFLEDLPRVNYEGKFETNIGHRNRALYAKLLQDAINEDYNLTQTQKMAIQDLQEILVPHKEVKALKFNEEEEFKIQNMQSHIQFIRSRPSSESIGNVFKEANKLT